MTMLTRGLSFAAVALLSALAGAQGPCTPVPASGCPGATAPNCTGSVRIGSTLQVTCINSGRGSIAQALYLGACVPAPVVLPLPFLCGTAPCTIAVDLSAVIVVHTGFQTISVPIPNRVLLVGQTVCLQCLDVISPPDCLQVSEAQSATITM